MSDTTIHSEAVDNADRVKEGIDQGTVDAARALESKNYSAGFSTEIEQEFAPKGLNEDIVRFISAKKEAFVLHFLKHALISNHSNPTHVRL